MMDFVDNKVKTELTVLVYHTNVENKDKNN